MFIISVYTTLSLIEQTIKNWNKFFLLAIVGCFFEKIPQVGIYDSCIGQVEPSSFIKQNTLYYILSIISIQLQLRLILQDNRLDTVRNSEILQLACKSVSEPWKQVLYSVHCTVYLLTTELWPSIISVLLRWPPSLKRRCDPFLYWNLGCRSKTVAPNTTSPLDTELYLFYVRIYA